MIQRRASSRARVPAKPHASSAHGSDASPGILTATTLQCILSAPPSSTNRGRRRPRASHRDGSNYNDGEDVDEQAVTSPYDPRFSGAAQTQLVVQAASMTPRRQSETTHRLRPPAKIELRRKRCTKRLQPMAAIAPAPLPPLSSLLLSVGDSNAKQATNPATLGNQSGSARDLRSGADAPAPVTRKQLPYQQQQRHFHPDHRPTGVAHQDSNDRLQGEIQWIHQHLPVLKLATAKCSLKLRQKLFATTISAHFTRAQLRSHLGHWKRIVTQQKQLELMQLRASQRIVQLFHELSMDVVGLNFRVWRDWMLESRQQEQLAACVAIQKLVRQQHSQRDREASQRASRGLRQTLERMQSSAKKIQRAYQTHVCVHHLQVCLRAVRRIQTTVRQHQQRRRLQRERSAAVKIQRLYRRHVNAQQASLSEMVAHAFTSHKARTIQRYWRNYAVWKHCALPLVCVSSLVDRVEYLAAVASIQSHIMGFLCRRHLRKCHAAARSLQHCWSAYHRRQSARRARKMEQVRQSTAACCLQRTFKRNRERLRFRKTMQRSTRPMYLRACDVDHESGSGDAARFRERFYVEIVKSAVSVIQSSWRKHVKYAKWKAERIAVATKLQQFLRRAARMARWHGGVRAAVQVHHEQVQSAAARRIQQCWRHLESRRADAASTASIRLIQELAGLVRAAICIQRQFRRSKKDRWHVVARRVVYVELPRRRAAVKRIWRLWRSHHDRKQQLLREFSSNGLSSSRGMDLASLKQLLVKQQLQLEREQRAAKRIQRMHRRFVDKRNGKLLLQRYRVLMRQELRKREQRKIIHGFLDERAKKQQLKQKTSMKRAGVDQGVLSSAATSSASSSMSHGSTAGSETSGAIDGGTETSPWQNDDSIPASEGESGEQQQFWSDEYQRAYLYNSRTGESVWL